MTILNNVKLYTIAVPIVIIKDRVKFDDHVSIPQSWRISRTLDKQRVRRIGDSLKFGTVPLSAPLVCVDAELLFIPHKIGDIIGYLQVPDESNWILADGQHRLSALSTNNNLSDETIPIHLLSDPGLKFCQNIFDSIHHRSRGPSRDQILEITKKMATECPVFSGFVDWKRNALAPRSAMLFTLSALTFANLELLRHRKNDPKAYDLATAFWCAVDSVIPSWSKVRSGQMTAGTLRSTTISSHGVMLQAMGRAAATLLKTAQIVEHMNFACWANLNWSREKPLWNGAAVIDGKVRKSAHAVERTATILANLIDER